MAPCHHFRRRVALAVAANPRRVEGVRARKLCIVSGRGFVHGTDFELGQRFGMALAP